MIAPKRLVVVVFPFVPVIASTSPFPFSYASSTSPQILTPCSLILFTTGKSVGTPGLSTARSSVSITSSFSSPIIICALLFGASLPRTSSSFIFSFPSYRIGNAPTFSSRSAEPIPLIPVPKTRTFFCFQSIQSS